MDNEKYITAKNMFLNGKSLRQIGEELNINRKKLSLMLRKENIYTDKKINIDILEKAIKMIELKKGITKIAEELNVDRHTLSKELNKLGKRKPTKRHSRCKKYDDIILHKYKKEKKSIETISKELSVSTNLVWNCLIDFNIVESTRLFSKYEYNTKLFKSIETEWEAYWLGFLYADGYINIYETVIELCLQKRDEEHVKKFRNYLSNKTNSYDKDVNGHMQHRINIHSKELAKNLVKCGCENNKTFKLKFPNGIVPKHLIRHFIRGFFDADGSIYYNDKRLNFNIVCASYEFIYEIQNILIKELDINKTKISKNRKIYYIRNGKQSDIKKLYNYLYKDATIYLERKHNKFKNIYN